MKSLLFFTLTEIASIVPLLVLSFFSLADVRVIIGWIKCSCVLCLVGSAVVVVRRKTTAKYRLLVGIGICTVNYSILVQAFLFPETYFIPYPSIDTRYADGYRHRAFSSIDVGMSKAQVISILGAPLFEFIEHAEEGQNCTEDQVRYVYSTDGKCTWADFAWLQRNVVFTNGIVCRIEKSIIFD